MSHAISNSRSRLFIEFRDPHSRFQAVEYDGRFFVNPGSATGAWTGLWNGCVLHGGRWTIDHKREAHPDSSGTRRLHLR
jgi:hypothetical protein